MILQNPHDFSWNLKWLGNSLIRIRNRPGSLPIRPSFVEEGREMQFALGIESSEDFGYNIYIYIFFY